VIAPFSLGATTTASTTWTHATGIADSTARVHNIGACRKKKREQG